MWTCTSKWANHISLHLFLKKNPKTFIVHTLVAILQEASKAQSRWETCVKSHSWRVESGLSRAQSWGFRPSESHGLWACYFIEAGSPAICCISFPFKSLSLLWYLNTTSRTRTFLSSQFLPFWSHPTEISVGSRHALTFRTKPNVLFSFLV